MSSEWDTHLSLAQMPDWMPDSLTAVVPSPGTGVNKRDASGRMSPILPDPEFLSAGF